MLLQFLRTVTSASRSNKMTLNSVAMIIAPNLFLVGTSAPVNNTSARRAPKRIRQLLEVSTAAGISSVIRLIIYYQDLLWQVLLSFRLALVLLLSLALESKVYCFVCQYQSVSCFSKIQIGFTFLVPAHLGSPGKRAVKRVCVYQSSDWL